MAYKVPRKKHIASKKATSTSARLQPVSPVVTPLHTILLEAHYLLPEDIASVSENIIADDVALADYLVREGVLSEDIISQAIAEFHSLPYINLSSHPPVAELVQLIPEEMAIKLHAVVISADEKSVTVATDILNNPELLSELKQVFPGRRISVAYATKEGIDTSFIHYRKSLATRFSKIIAESERIAPEILEEIFEDAHTFRASDIHFEPQRDEVVVRFRIDGVMHEAGRLAKEYYENMLNRIKVQSRLRIDEHLAAQDGSIHYEHGKYVFDMRTSIVPTVEGEKVVLRILSTYIKNFSLSTLGLTPANQALVQKASQKPFGMILMTGPTGSGKTTMLYAILKLLHKPEVNITTIEDPVEYKMIGVNQIQVNANTNLTFANGLRSVVRQDPDVILVGEIRDTETAEIAVNAALTGHLLLSTFHANDAATAIPRLLDMGVEPFLLASTLELVAGQRLVREICNNCKYSVVISHTELTQRYPGAEKYLGKQKKVTLYAGKGCTACGGTGYYGRSAIFELIRVTAAIQERILKNASAQEIWKVAQKEGSKSLFDDGIEKVKNGVTTLEELLRVASPSE